MSIDITGQRIHIVGVKGAGVSALARMLQARGNYVCGSDVAERFFTDEGLEQDGIRIESFSSDHVVSHHFDMVIYSTAWKDSDEVARARQQGVMVVSYPEALGIIFNSGVLPIAVAGSHGKTTTAALVTHILTSAGHDPSAIVGSTMANSGTNMRAGHGAPFVIEADEYENKFAYYNPQALLVTNIDYDHPDYFTTRESYDEAFRAFVEKTRGRSGVVIACGDDAGVRRVLGDDVIRYGTDQSFPYAVTDIVVLNGLMHYTLHRNGENIGTFSLALPGRHNAVNACGAIALCDMLGLVDAQEAAHHAETFRGVARRFEYKGQYEGMRIYDDYAHHPTEIGATLSMFRMIFPTARIWCVFGAHTYTRTAALFDDFAKSFSTADHVLLLDIFGSARERDGERTGQDLASAISRQSGNAEYIGTHDRACEVILGHIDEIDVLVTMGAGDVYKIGEEICVLSSKERQKSIPKNLTL
ncbi:MAG: UDP-N-acetylmuramate--L-alanine ligase [Patescibacteria group bacterium]